MGRVASSKVHAGQMRYDGPPAAAAASAPLAPAPAPRLHWSNWVLVGGAAAMALALVLAITGMPGKLFYDVDAAGRTTEYSGHDAWKMSQAIDANLKYIRDATADEPDRYNGLLKSIDASQNVIPPMGRKLQEMNGAVVAIDSGLGSVLRATERMSADMAAMATTSATSADTMQQVASDVAVLGETMRTLYGESSELDAALRRIERKAAKIATKRTGPAADATRELNAVLPEGVPPPKTSLDPDGAQ